MDFTWLAPELFEAATEALTETDVALDETIPEAQSPGTIG
jgi:hypothetical protein